MKQKMRELFRDYPVAVRFDEPLSPYTSLKVGGVADVMLFPKSTSDIVAALETIDRHRLPFFVLGKGSNLLIRDGGIAGVVLQIGSTQITRSGEMGLVADAGVSFPRLSIMALSCGLSGLEFAAGIPGTVGGAVVMNAGIPKEETAAILTEVMLVREDGCVEIVKRADIPFEYRRSRLPSGIVTSASFHLTPAPKEQILEKQQGLLALRRETQPLSEPNMGSVFKNPEGTTAGTLIESVGLKGYRIGAAQVSPRHANFIVNCGCATANDVWALIHTIGEKVERECGVTLALEVRIVGRV
jgi:UDP-N-acetylmuramate dehydrogenase